MWAEPLFEHLYQWAAFRAPLINGSQGHSLRRRRRRGEQGTFVKISPNILQSMTFRGQRDMGTQVIEVISGLRGNLEATVALEAMARGNMHMIMHIRMQKQRLWRSLISIQRPFATSEAVCRP